MRKTKLHFWTLRALALMAILCPQQSFAQGQFGGYLTDGVQSGSLNSPNSVGTPAAGAFYDRSFGKFTAGADLRGLAGSLGVTGFGVGPRVTFPMAHRLFIPYAECLFGNGNTSTSTSASIPPTQVSGTLITSSIGLDVFYNSYVGMRIINFDYGTVSNNVASHLTAVSFGIVLRFKTP